MIAKEGSTFWGDLILLAEDGTPVPLLFVLFRLFSCEFDGRLFQQNMIRSTDPQFEKYRDVLTTDVFAALQTAMPHNTINDDDRVGRAQHLSTLRTRFLERHGLSIPPPQSKQFPHYNWLHQADAKFTLKKDIDIIVLVHKPSAQPTPLANRVGSYVPPAREGGQGGAG
jgi:hypothetical protein